MAEIPSGMARHSLRRQHNGRGQAHLGGAIVLWLFDNMLITLVAAPTPMGNDEAFI
jgi:hypothetical protein